MPRSNATRLPAVRVVSGHNRPSQARKMRRPQHRFNVRSKAYEITPFLIAPVLPGETMQSLLMQARAVSDPVLNPLMGWWKEYYFFYVSHRTLTAYGVQTANLQSMMLDPATAVGLTHVGASSPSTYEFKGAVSWVQGCLDVVAERFFRDEGEGLGQIGPNGRYLAKADTDSWMHSMTVEGLALDAHPVGDDAAWEAENDVISGMEAQYAQWMIMRDAQMTDLTYEDYLRTYGVEVPKAQVQNDGELGVAEQPFQPELLRFVRAWQYPTNTVNPANGSPASALSWSMTEKADKKRFFREPGFIFGVTVTRPKAYVGYQQGVAAGLLNSPYAWLPATLQGFPYASLKDVDDDGTTGGIVPDVAGDLPGFWIDYKDLFLHGDQMIIGDDSDRWTPNLVSIPNLATSNFKYPNGGDFTAPFVDGAKNDIHEDGIVHLNILSTMSDTTP